MSIQRLFGLKGDLADALLRTDSIVFRDGEGGTRAPYDVEIDFHDMELRAICGRAVLDVIANRLPDMSHAHIMGILTGNMLVTWLTDIGGLRLNRIRYATSDERATGANLIQGAYSWGDTALMVDDMIISTYSKGSRIRKLQVYEGLNITALVVVVDFQYDSQQYIRDHGVTIAGALTMAELLGHAAARDIISPAAYQEAMDWLAGKGILHKREYPTATD